MTNRLRGLDANFWHLHTPTTQQVIACFCPLSSIPNKNDVEQCVERLLTTYPRLRHKVTSARSPKWIEDSTFSIHNHLSWHKVSTGNALENIEYQASQIYSTPWDMAKPPWHLSILFQQARERQNEGFPPAAFLLRIHHALADGLSGLSLITTLCNINILHSTPKKSSPNTTRPSLVRRFRNFAAASSTLISEWLSPPGLSSLNGENSSARTLTCFDLPFDELRLMAKQCSSSLNDVLLALVSGAVRRHHIRSQTPLSVLRAIMPVNLRPAHSFSALGNSLTAVGIHMPLALDDPQHRLQEINAYVQKLKSNGGLFAYGVGANVTAFLPRSLQLRIAEFQARRTNFICTNMPGPKDEMYFAGTRILGQYGMAALLRGHGVSFAFISYAQRVCCSIVSDPAILPSPRELLDDFSAAYLELRNAISSGSENISALSSPNLDSE